MASSQLEQKQKTPLMGFFCCYLPFREHTYLCTETKKVLLHRTFSTVGELAYGRLLPYYLIS